MDGVETNIPDPLDTVWKALSDPTRRRVLDLLRMQARTTGELTAAFPGLSRFAVMKHLGVLQEAGLLVVRREGRKRWNHLNAVPLRRVYERWVSRYEDVWADSLLRLKETVETEDAVAIETQEARVVIITEEIEISADARRVYDAFTESNGKWFWRGEKNQLPETRLEAKAGGRWYRDQPDGSTDLYGVVTALRPGKMIRIDGSISGKYATASVSQIDLNEEGGKTRVRVTHRLAGEVVQAEVDDYQEGWRDELSSLKRFVETGRGRGD
jgi:DNA-binding transcriptional ArsR family regulator